jgi:Tol biopolymer transport system component
MHPPQNQIPEQITHSPGNDQLLYFTSTSLLSDNRGLVFLSDRTDEKDECWAGSWLALMQVDWSGGKIDWRPLTRHGSSWTSQDVHPHPLIDERCENAYFTSDRDGRCAVYRVAI